MEIKSAGVWPENFVKDTHLARCSIHAEGFLREKCGFIAPEGILNTLKKHGCFEDEPFSVVTRGLWLNEDEAVVYAPFDGVPNLQREGENMVVVPKSYCVITGIHYCKKKADSDETQVCERCEKEVHKFQIYVLKSGEVVCWGCLQEIVEGRLESDNAGEVVEAIEALNVLIRTTERRKQVEAFIKNLNLTDEEYAILEENVSPEVTENE